MALMFGSSRSIELSLQRMDAHMERGNAHMDRGNAHMERGNAHMEWGNALMDRGNVLMAEVQAEMALNRKTYAEQTQLTREALRRHEIAFSGMMDLLGDLHEASQAHTLAAFRLIDTIEERLPPSDDAA